LLLQVAVQVASQEFTFQLTNAVAVVVQVVIALQHFQSIKEFH
jgi:hypothetical protein